jgi:hypothetical protein
MTTMKRVYFVSLVLVLLGCISARAAEPAPNDATITIEVPELAGMSMFRAHWDTPLVLRNNIAQRVVDAKITDRGGVVDWKEGTGPAAFDALNRALLVRFPEAAEKIAAELAKGKTIASAHVVLPYRDEEIWPVGQVDFVSNFGYTYRTNWGVDAMYRALRPRWHAVAWALRRPWKADATIGPTFNAAVNGAVYWTRYGATDTTHDRYPNRLGPTEVSSEQPQGKLDVTALLNDPAYGATLAQRLRNFADNGLLIQKEETYDAKFFAGVYEFATATGPRAIVINRPSLQVTFASGKTDLGGALAKPADIAALASGPKVGAPTAVLPDEAALKRVALKLSTKPQNMPDWQWKRVTELLSLEKARTENQPFWYLFVPEYVIDRLAKIAWVDKKKVYEKQPDPMAVYQMWVDMWIGRPVRGWSGFESARAMAEWNLFHEALPGPAQDAVKRYWTAWLMPERETALDPKQRRDLNDVSGKLVHPMCDDPRVGGPKAVWPDPTAGRFDTYVTKTGDWRGNKSFFRSGFCYDMSTQNFNSTASSGALLAGTIIGSPNAIADGRNGVEQWLLRSWCWNSGLGQEHIDHYYFAHTLVGNKSIADFSAEPFDKLQGQSLLAKGIEELASAYHPSLRSFIAGSSRSSLEFLLGMQDGLQHIVHTLSKSGAERDLGVDTFPIGGYKRIGHDASPELVAQLSIVQPWAPEWVTTIVDEKTLPYEVIGTGWGGGVRRKYFGKNYGISTNETAEGRFQAMAQWRREPVQPQRTAELGTIDIRYGLNDTRFTNDGQGVLSRPGNLANYQYKNRFISVMTPRSVPDKDTWKKDVLSMQSSIGFFTLQDNGPTWEIYVDGKKQDKLPITCKQGQKITIRDGVTYLGIIPLPATDLGRGIEVLLDAGQPQKMDLNYYNSTMKASLVISSYNFQHIDSPLSDPKMRAAVTSAYGGFTVEFGDVDEWGTFEKFQQHIATAKAQVAFDKKTGIVDVTYTSGDTTLRAGTPTAAADKKAPIQPFTVNGKNAGIAEGIELDTPYAQQGWASVAKNGATLTGDKDRRLFLLTEPKAGVYCAWNPLPDLNTITFTVPGGMTIKSDGKISLARLTARPKERSLEIDCGYKDSQLNDPAAAATVTITGIDGPPVVTVNGKKMTTLQERVVDGKKGWVVPIK